MQNSLIVRGLPRSVAQDAWWLASETLAPGGNGIRTPNEKVFGSSPIRRNIFFLLAVLIAGDFLVYGHAPGLSLALFGCVLFAAGIQGLSDHRQAIRPAILFGLAALPVIEFLQALSLAFLMIGLFVSVAWARVGNLGVGSILTAAGQMIKRIPVLAPTLVIESSSTLRRGIRTRVKPGRLMQEWALPVGGALVILTLLSGANPVLSEWLGELLDWDVDMVELTMRILFWTGAALIAWPLIDMPNSMLSGTRPRLALPAASWFGVNARSVSNALVVFNAIMAIQTVMDLQYLWIGGSLPDGLSYATYAHRGAYPLVATALLAGAFALSARPYLAERRGLRLLVILWIAQNVLLASSAAYRLWIYVEVYNLTYLRIHAGVWMCMVSVGLALIGWQIWRDRSNIWLIARCTSLGLGVLYISCFVNFAQVIGQYNVHQKKVDHHYLCQLGPMAAPSLFDAALPCDIYAPVIHGWRDWGFRKWRVARYLDMAAIPEPMDEDTRRR